MIIKTLTSIMVLLIPLTSFCQKKEDIKTKDGILHYETYGKGDPLLIINGGPGLDCRGFVPLAKLLSDNYTTILFDQRGNGNSTLINSDSTTVTMHLMADDIETIRKQLKIDKWVVLGHSFGGWMAEYYAEKYPESIKAMILSSSAGVDLSLLSYISANINIHLSQTERDSLNFYKNKISKGDTTYITRYHKAKILASAYVFNKEYVPSIAQRLAGGLNTKISELVYSNLYKINFDCKKTLKDFDKPVLIIQGRQDLTGDGIAYETKAIFKNATIKFMNESAHYSWLEKSDEYKTEVEKFIAGIK